MAVGLAQGSGVWIAGQFEAVLGTHPQPVLDQPKLDTLESRGRDQEVAELEEVERGHGFEHADLLDQQLLDLGDAVEAGDDSQHLGFGNSCRGEQLGNLVEFPEDLLEPQFVSLVDDDEQHLVVYRRSASGRGQLLAVQQPIELQIVRVVERLGGRRVSHARNPSSRSD